MLINGEVMTVVLGDVQESLGVGDGMKRASERGFGRTLALRPRGGTDGEQQAYDSKGRRHHRDGL